MAFLTFWLPIIGGILLGGIAGNAWYGGDRIFAIWAGFFGLICFLLLGVLQIQQLILSSGTAHAASGGEPARPPTLEATRNSTIDASGAQIPGDLPFPFGRADENSLIAMPGLVVTKTETGYTITSGHSNMQFPAPTAEFVVIPTSELKQRLQAEVASLRAFQIEFDNEFYEPNRSWPGESKSKAVLSKYSALYSEKFSKQTLALASAALSRVGSMNSSEISKQASQGGSVVYYGKFAGPDPALRAAAFLETLADHLPD